MMMKEKTQPKKIRNERKRLGVLLGLCGAVALLVLIRLFWLQIASLETRAKAVHYTRNTEPILPERGTITDRNGYIFARDEKIYKLQLFFDESVDRKVVRKELLDTLSLPEADVNEWMKREGFVDPGVTLEAPQAEAMLKKDVTGIHIRIETARRIPNGLLSSGLVGFTTADHEGAIGVEAAFNTFLRGTAGKKRLFSYSGNIPTPYQEAEVFPAKRGYDIALTIDAGIQEILMKRGAEGQEQFTPAKMSVIAMDPNTGAILGLADFPALDANRPRAGRTAEEENRLKNLTEEERLDMYYDMWRSFSVQDVYEPGSVFKVITAASAYEEGTATDNDVYQCDGYVTDIPGTTIRCWSYYNPHGAQTLTEAMDNSCNPAFVQMIRKLGKAKSRQYIEAFGFGNQTGIGLPAEGEGILPPTPDEINEAVFATNSYGHGVAVTPLQMLSAISAVVNGGTLYQPQIIHEMKDEFGNTVDAFRPKPIRTVISERTSERMRELLEHGAKYGTADGAYIDGYRIGGKTGTSVKFVDGAYTTEQVVASYVGVFPADKPEIAVLVVVDEPVGSNSGNTSAAVIAKWIFEDYIAMHDLAPTEAIENTEKSEPDNPVTYPVETLPDGEDEEEQNTDTEEPIEDSDPSPNEDEDAEDSDAE